MAIESTTIYRRNVSQAPCNKSRKGWGDENAFQPGGNVGVERHKLCHSPQRQYECRMNDYYLFISLRRRFRQ